MKKEIPLILSALLLLLFLSGCYMITGSIGNIRVYPVYDKIEKTITFSGCEQGGGNPGEIISFGVDGTLEVSFTIPPFDRIAWKDTVISTGSRECVYDTCNTAESWCSLYKGYYFNEACIDVMETRYYQSYGANYCSELGIGSYNSVDKVCKAPLSNFKDWYITPESNFMVNAKKLTNLRYDGDMVYGTMPSNYYTPTNNENFCITYILTKETPPDSDNDGITDDRDKCPYQSGSAPDGCPIPEPEKPAPKSMLDILQGIIDWIIDIFRSLSELIFPTEVKVQPGETHTYSISLSTSAPDSDYSDGTYQIQYASWAFIDKDQNIITEGQWEEVFGSYTKDITLTIPQEINDYVLIAMITQYDMYYDLTTGQWTEQGYEVLEKQAIDIESEAPIPDKPSPNPITSFFSWIWNWIKSLFGW